MPSTEATGIFASDLLIRFALLQGIKDLRSNAWLLDYICAGMRQDDLTRGLYGEKEIEALKKWFKSTEIPVLMNARLGDIESPAVTINLVSSQEDINTLGDIHYEAQEDVGPAEGGDWPDLTAPFDPIFVVSTGIVTLPVSVTSDVFSGMVIMDAVGTPHDILEVLEPRVFRVAAGIPLDFSGATLRSGSPSQLQTLESANFKESYLIGCHVPGEPQLLIFLHTLVVFILQWGREELLEGRGFELSTFSSTDFSKNQAYDVENHWSRYINISGVVKHCWPKRRFQKIAGTATVIRLTGSDHLPPDMQPVSEQLWIGDKDGIG